MDIINLETLEGLPLEFIKKLADFNENFIHVNFLENLQDIFELQVIINEINHNCEKNRIFGFHYTRADRKSILKFGLIPRSGSEIRNKFLDKYGHKFTSQEKDLILKAWAEYFSKKQRAIRDGQIYFNLTQNALKNGGAEFLLKYYGGEQVYNPIYEIEGINDKLQCIGTPMILKCILNPKDLYTYIQNPWGSIAVASYHRLLNPNAFVIDQDAHQSTQVFPDNIEIIKFKNEYSTDYNSISG
jgi:hypothetical protein